jgi:hypothetical protein
MVVRCREISMLERTQAHYPTTYKTMSASPWFNLRAYRLDSRAFSSNWRTEPWPGISFKFFGCWERSNWSWALWESEATMFESGSHQPVVCEFKGYRKLLETFFIKFKGLDKESRWLKRNRSASNQARDPRLPHLFSISGSPFLTSFLSIDPSWTQVNMKVILIEEVDLPSKYSFSVKGPCCWCVNPVHENGANCHSLTCTCFPFLFTFRNCFGLGILDSDSDQDSGTVVVDGVGCTMVGFTRRVTKVDEWGKKI